MKAREATIAQLHDEQHQASIMLIAVRAERDRLQHQVWSSSKAAPACLSLILLAATLCKSLNITFCKSVIRKSIACKSLSCTAC